MKKLLLLLAFFCLVSCSVEVQPSVSFDEALFNQQLENWQKQNITHYSFTWYISGDTPNEDVFGYVTRKGKEYSVELKYNEEYFGEEKGKAKLPKEGDKEYMTSIDDAFNLIKSTYSEQKELFDKGDLFSVSVYSDYDNQFFFPKNTEIFYREDKFVKDAIGDEHPLIAFEIREFQILGQE